MTAINAAENPRLMFECDYMEGAHPKVLQALADTNMESVPGYGHDRFCDEAREKILSACGCPGGEVYFVGGGTQANQLVINAMLSPWQGVMAATSGHVSVHEAGAIEFTGHKVITLPGMQGKLSAEAVRACRKGWEADGNWDHMVEPGMVYISQPTEYGTLYNLDELRAISQVCHECGIPLYVDGARLAYALACPVNNVNLPDLAQLADAFYIGGTKCGALCGEAIVFPRAGTVPRFFTRIKQQGALFAKGRLLGVQFGALFEDDLYFKLGRPAIEGADCIRTALRERGYQIYVDSPTNQTFFVIENSRAQELGRRVAFSFGERYDENHSVIRLCTSWATSEQHVKELVGLL